MPLNKELHKVMLIGSGPIVIGQAAEFDYAGTQACRALKEEGLELSLIHISPAVRPAHGSVRNALEKRLKKEKFP